MIGQAMDQQGRYGAWTLIEVLVVLVITIILSGTVGSGLISAVEKAKVSAASSEIAVAKGALLSFYLDTGSYPQGVHPLEQLVDIEAVPLRLRERWRGPYLSQKIDVDPWGRPYEYELLRSPGIPELWSLGADGFAGGEGFDADIR